MWLVFTVLAVVCRAIFGVLTKVLSNFVKVNPMTQTTLLMVAATLFGLLLSPLLGGIHLEAAGPVWPILAIAIVTSTLGNVLYFKGISTLQSGTTQITFSSILIWGAIMSWLFLSSRFSLLQSLGMLVLLVAILLAQYQGKSLKFERGVWLILASAACFAGFQVSSAMLAKTLTPGTYIFATYLGNAVLIGVPYLAQIRRDLIATRSHRSKLFFVAAITGAASIVFNVFAYLAYQIAPDAGLVVVLLTSQVVLAVILSIIFLRERDHIGLKLTAGVLVLVAAIMIKI